jgi:hypothetical protein
MDVLRLTMEECWCYSLPMQQLLHCVKKSTCVHCTMNGMHACVIADYYSSYLTFFTNWSIILLGFAGLVAFANTARHYHRERRGYKLHRQFLAGRATAAAAVARDSAPAAANGGGMVGSDNGVTGNGTAASPAGVMGDMERGDAGVEQSPKKHPLTAPRKVSSTELSSELEAYEYLAALGPVLSCSGPEGVSMQSKVCKALCFSVGSPPFCPHSHRSNACLLNLLSSSSLEPVVGKLLHHFSNGPCCLPALISMPDLQ